MRLCQIFQQGKEFSEDLLGLTTLHCHTRGEDIYEAIMQMLDERGIDIKILVSIATDGAPAMLGKEMEAVQHLKEKHAGISLHNTPVSAVCQS